MSTTFADIAKLNYIDQAKWFLNGFWEAGLDKEAENIWKYANKFVELDQQKKEGSELDEFLSHKFLESFGETLTVRKLREEIRKMDLEVQGKGIPLIEYLAVKYCKSVPQVVGAPQGGNKKEISEAETKLQAVQNAYAEVHAQFEQQTRALEEQKIATEASRKALIDQREAEGIAKSAQDAASKALNDQKKAEEVVRKAKDEHKAAVDDLTKQEEAYKNQIATLETKSKDASASIVVKNKAANELAQLKSEDPLPLRKAKITQEAALRKVEKEIKAAEAVTKIAEGKAKEAADKLRDAKAATIAAEQKSKEAEEKTTALEEQKKRVEASFAEAESKVKEAVDCLEGAKKKGGAAYGSIWWMERELKEAQKYLPQRKQQQQQSAPANIVERK